MKKTILLFAIIFSLFSCSKDEEPTPTNANYRVKTKTEKVGANTYVTQYEYNANGKFSKVSYVNGSSTTYSYNSANLLIKTETTGDPNYNLLYTTFTYNASNNLEEQIYYTRANNSAIINKYRTTFTYAGINLTQAQQYQWNNLTNNWVPNPSVTNYEYNANGKLSKIDELGNSRYFLMTYDAAGNMTKTDQYDLKPGSTTQYYLRRTTTRTFDTKKANNTSFSEIPNYFNPNYYTSGGNNEIDVVNKYYTEAGVVENSYAHTNTYQYNDAGYPTKISGGIVDTDFVLEKY